VKSKEAAHGEYDNEGAESGPVIRSHLGRKGSSTSSMVIDVSSVKQSAPYALSLRS